MGRLIGTTTSYSFLASRNFTNAYAYDAASNRTGFTDPESGSTAYTYDTLNRLTSLAPPSAFGSGSFGFSYDALSRRTQMTRPNSVATNYAYDNLSRLTSVLHQLAGSTIDGASYTLDSAGNRTAKTNQLAAVTSNYTYDAIYQLTQVTQANNTTESYSYDAVGNRTASLGVSSYTTNASNELTATSNASYTYDSNGNMLTKTVGSNTTSYTWDFENRLTSVTLPNSGGTVTFKYDPFGKRIYKSSSGGTSVFAYDGEALIEETNSSGSVVARYTQGQDIDESLALLRGTTTDYYNADGLGSVTSLTASNGSVAQSYAYDSFGNTTNSTGSLTNSFRYTAREFDTETNLYEYRARYYDPGVGRFLSEDPIQFDGGINFYAYTANDPVGLVDPSGMSPAQGNANGYWPPANLDDPALSPIAHYPWPSSGRFYGVGQGPTGGQQCVALTRHFTSLPCTDCWRVGPKVIGNTIPAGTAIATFDKNGRYPQSGNANSGLYVATYPGNKIVIVDQWPPNAVTHGPAKPAGARTLGPAPGDPSDDSGSYSVITVPRGTESSHCKCGNW